ncbi:MAG: pyridoxamine 5'-phosphate oxidase family protein [Roseobacter sp.]
MANQFDALNDTLVHFIEAQHVFFVGSAGPEGRVNISPKGMDSLRIMGPNRLIWRNLTGSGNETAGHLAQINRMTLMWCSYTAKPMIMRIYGQAKTLHPRDEEFSNLNAQFDAHVGARQIYDVTFDLVQTSCGYAVPFMDYTGERSVLDTWTANKGAEGVEDYWRQKNQKTIDGAATYILQPEE